jgi:hypothetical protein
MGRSLKRMAIAASRPILKAIATSEWGWRFVHHPLSRCVAHMQSYRNDMRFPASVPEEHRRIERELAKDLVVRRGPFAGMRYPSLARLGSACMPKLLGVYEEELFPIFEKVAARNYSEILNIGCAEGYYAVGMAMLNPEARVIAYDINPRQREFCVELARLNGVADRIDVQAACTADVLAKFAFTGHGFILCDCEGYESELFTSLAVANLRNCDVLVELHDHIDLTITDKILGEFAATHTATLVPSVDTVKRAKTVDLPELRGVDLEVRRRVLTERYAVMDWAFLEPRSPNE